MFPWFLLIALGLVALQADAPVERIEYPYPDEVGDRVDALNESRARLYESMRHLSALNLDLERLIPVRTADLQEAKERADAADRIKSAFLATISHELRTPLNSIIGFTGILLQGLVWPLNDEEKKQLGMVRDSSTHLLELLGGSIWVESHLGEGSVFASVLPVKGGKS